MGWGLRPSLHPSTQDVEAGGAEVRGQPSLCAEFTTSLNYKVRPQLGAVKQGRHAAPSHAT